MIYSRFIYLYIDIFKIYLLTPDQVNLLKYNNVATGKYDNIDKIIGWLEKAQGVAENKAQGDALGLLIKYYQTGDLQTWDDYNVAWTKATEGDIDYINGFVDIIMCSV